MAGLSLLLTLIILVAYSGAIYQLIRQKQISEIKSDFINNMTHEFKTPIATINLAVEAIRNPQIISDKSKVDRYLEIIRDEIGFEGLKKKVKRDLNELKVAPYYGCQILRPESVLKLDDPENPKILDDFLASLGCEVVDFPFKVECCGSYQILNERARDVVLGCSYAILNSAQKNGAEAVALTCPVCYFNLDKKQADISEKFGDFKEVPILYFTELLGLALDVDKNLFDFEKHFIDPRPLLKEKGIFEGLSIHKKEEGK